MHTGKAARKKLKVWADKIRMQQLTRTEAWILTRAGICKTLQYPLAATTMTKAQCKELDKQVQKSFLLAIGLPMSTPAAVFMHCRRISDWQLRKFGSNKASNMCPH